MFLTPSTPKHPHTGSERPGRKNSCKLIFFPVTISRGPLQRADTCAVLQVVGAAITVGRNWQPESQESQQHAQGQQLGGRAASARSRGCGGSSRNRCRYRGRRRGRRGLLLAHVVDKDRCCGCRGWCCRGSCRCRAARCRLDEWLASHQRLWRRKRRGDGGRGRLAQQRRQRLKRHCEDLGLCGGGDRWREERIDGSRCSGSGGGQRCRLLATQGSERRGGTRGNGVLVCEGCCLCQPTGL